VTHLRKIMLEELQGRHYSEATTRYYVSAVEAFARYSSVLRIAWAGPAAHPIWALRFFYIRRMCILPDWRIFIYVGRQEQELGV
jgi:hypothetical protein